MIVKTLLPAIGLTSVAFCCSSCGTDNRHFHNRPNVLFILADDMGYGELSCFNPSTPVQTPNIDRIAQAGVKMTQAYAAPVSSPTRASFLTGRFAHNVGVYGNFDGTSPGIGPQRRCFAEEMQAEGYQTSWFGKWHQGWDLINHPANNGFDKAFGFLGGMHDYYDPAEGSHYSGGPFAKHAYVFDGFRQINDMDYLTIELTNQFIDYIDQIDPNKPFFTYLSYNAPHTPFQAPEEYVQKYISKGFDPVLATRYAMVDVLDVQVGRILDKLHAECLDENTLVIFMTDNGPESEKMSGGLRGTKMTVWEGGVRVPLVARLPGIIPAGIENDAICSIADMAATFICLATGQSYSPDNQEDYLFGDGKSLMPYFMGKEGDVHDRLVFAIQLDGPVGSTPQAKKLGFFGVREGDWKLVVDKKRGIDALYNLKEDIAERYDLSEQYPQIKDSLYQHGSEDISKASPACGKIASNPVKHKCN